MNFSWDKYWKCLRRTPMRCNWNLTETKFGIVLEDFQWDAIENWLRQNLEVSYKNSDEMQLNFGWDPVWKYIRINNKSDEKQLNFGWDRIWNCLRKIPMRLNLILAQTVFGTVLENFRWEAIDFWLKQILKCS